MNGWGTSGLKDVSLFDDVRTQGWEEAYRGKPGNRPSLPTLSWHLLDDWEAEAMGIILKHL